MTDSPADGQPQPLRQPPTRRSRVRMEAAHRRARPRRHAPRCHGPVGGPEPDGPVRLLLLSRRPPAPGVSGVGGSLPGGELVVVRAESPDVTSQDYLGRVEALGSTLASLPGVSQVYSVATERPSSPLWSRILVPRTAKPPTWCWTWTWVRVRERCSPTRIERGAHRPPRPDFELIASGVPLIVELIRRESPPRPGRIQPGGPGCSSVSWRPSCTGTPVSWGGTLTACVGACARPFS